LGSLARLVLPDPPTGKALREAVRSSLGFLDVAPDHVTVPQYGGIWRAVLGLVDFSLHLVGETNTRKTEMTALCQQHFGSGMDARNLPGSWTSTANSLEGLFFAAADVVVVVDDFAPRGPDHDVQRYHAAADRVFRSVGNHAGRGRARQDGTPRAPRPPRCLVFSSGEEVPRGHSCRGRIGIIEVLKGDVDLEHLTLCQRDARDGLYAAAMAGFVKWLADGYREARDTLKDEVASLRERYKSQENHGRTGGILGDLHYGLRLFLMFARDSQAITRAESGEYGKRFSQALLALGSQQAQHQLAEEPAGHFLRLIRAALSSGRAHVADANVCSFPQNQVAWGWRERGGQWLGQGACVGWHEGTEILLDPESAYATAQVLAREQNDSLGITPQTLGKRLHERGYLIAVEERRSTVRRRCQRVRRYVWLLDEKLFLDAT
jgi:hypothetical protein